MPYAKDMLELLRAVKNLSRPIGECLDHRIDEGRAAVAAIPLADAIVTPPLCPSCPIYRLPVLAKAPLVALGVWPDLPATQPIHRAR